LEYVVNDLREMKVKRWRKNAVDREESASVINEVKALRDRAKESSSKQATCIAPPPPLYLRVGLPSTTGQLKCDGTRRETRFRLSAKRKSPFKSAGALVRSITGSRGVASAVVMLDTPCYEVV
jgi:hypothetical protein